MTFREKVFYRIIWQALSRQLLKEALPVRGVGAERVPPGGSYLVVANHRCWLDPVFISQVVRRPIQWAGVDFHYKMPLVSRIAKASGLIPISVEGGKRSRQQLKLAAEILKKKGALVGIFPEGVANFLNPSPEKIIRFHTGFVRIALQARVSCIPIAVKGYGEEEVVEVPGRLLKLFTPLEIFQKGVHLIVYSEAVVHIGQPVSLASYFDQPVEKALLYHIAEKLRQEVLSLYHQV